MSVTDEFKAVSAVRVLFANNLDTLMKAVADTPDDEEFYVFRKFRNVGKDEWRILSKEGVFRQC